MTRNKSNYLILTLLCVLSINCSKHCDFFSAMPHILELDSLNAFGEYIDEFKVERTNNCNIVLLEGDTQAIQFTGYLHLIENSIFYSKCLDSEKKMLFDFSRRKFSNWKITYNDERRDSIIYLGKIRNNKDETDSLYLYYFIPILRNSKYKRTYSKFVALNRHYIRFITLSNELNEATIDLNFGFPKICKMVSK